MFHSRSRKIAVAALVVIAGIALIALPARHIKGADHAEATGVAGDPGADIADVFAFLDPNDNSKVVLALDVEGFIVPSELLNLASFHPTSRTASNLKTPATRVPTRFLKSHFRRRLPGARRRPRSEEHTSELQS